MAYEIKNKNKPDMIKQSVEAQKWIEEERKKILTVDRILAVPIRECGERMVKTSDAGIYTALINEDMEPYTGKDIFLRESIVSDLEHINKNPEIIRVI